LQRSFPIDDIFLRSGDISDQVAKLSEILYWKIYLFCAATFSRGEYVACGVALLSDRHSLGCEILAEFSVSTPDIL